jgi:hypothetical protein
MKYKKDYFINGQELYKIRIDNDLFQVDFYVLFKLN